VDEANDLDAQLKAAVDDLLGRLPAGHAPAANASTTGDQPARPG
jgi:hypothetical protein